MRRLAFLVAAVAVLLGMAVALEPDDAGDGLRTDPVSLEGAVDQVERGLATLEAQGPPPASSMGVAAPTEGARVSGLTAVRVRAPAGTDWIAVYACGGQSVGEDSVVDAGGEWSVQWDTRSCPNGQQDLDSWAFRDGGASLGNATITTQVSNSAPAPAPEPVACEPVSAPGPIAGQGYGERFSDCFDTLDRTTWCSHQWWEANPPVGSQTVANGELRLRRDRANGYADTTMSTEPCGQANPKSFQYGYFEARMRHETVQGNGPAFWLFSTRHATNPAWPAINPLCAVGGQFLKAQCLSAELDVFEGFGRIFYGGSRTDDFFSGTLHRNSSGHYGESNQSRFVQRGTGLEMEDWHVYAARWTPTEIRYYIDGQLQGTVAPFDSTAQPMHLLLYNWNTEWEDENMPTASTEPELDTYVDWVRVWQDGAAPEGGAVTPGTPSGGDTSSPDTTPPRLLLGGKRRQRARRTISVIVKAASENLWATASGKVSILGSGKAYRLGRSKRRFIARGQKATLKLRVPTKALVATKRALRRDRVVRAKLTIKASDAAGNSTTKRRTIKLKR